MDQQEVYSAEAWQIMVACTGAFGGGSGIGATDATDGDLDVVIVPAGTRLGLARRAWGLRTKTIERQRSVSHFEGKVVEVELPPGPELNCDGEFVDGGLDYVTATANAFRLVVRVGPWPRPRAGRLWPVRSGIGTPSMIALDVGALEHLVAQELLRELVELRAVVREQLLPRGAWPRRRGAAARRRAAHACGRTPRRPPRRAGAR